MDWIHLVLAPEPTPVVPAESHGETTFHCDEATITLDTIIEDHASITKHTIKNEMEKLMTLIDETDETVEIEIGEIDKKSNDEVPVGIRKSKKVNKGVLGQKQIKQEKNMFSNSEEKNIKPTKQSRELRIHKVMNFVCDCSGVVSVKAGEEFGIKEQNFSRDFLSKEKHMRGVHEAWIACIFCKRLFENETFLKLHDKDHKNIKCSKCDFKPKDRHDLQNHKWSVHEPKTALCPMCGKVFENIILMRIHKRRCVDPSELSNRNIRIMKVQNFSCECSDAVTLKEGEEFGLKGKYLSRVFLAKEHHMKVKHEGWFGCTICPKSFEYERELLHHNKVHKQVPCQKCEYISKHRVDLRKHNVKVHDPKPSSCSICGNIYKNSVLMFSHKKRCVDSVEKSCELCGGMFKNIEQHMQILHTSDEEKKYQCTECERGFICKSMLVNHTMNVHIKSQPYQCRYGCENRYNDKGNMRAHEKRRHGEVFNYNRNL